ncbi:MAG: hypothetical protein ACI93R_000104 [Flavobacteriales bacterium]|jgi:hypothetical protein
MDYIKSLALVLSTLSIYAQADSNLHSCQSLSIQGELNLQTPKNSTDGVFTIKLDSNAPANKAIELYRNFNGGEFTLIETKKFNALSQTVYKQGKYGYRVELSCEKEGRKVVLSQSSHEYVDVELSFPNYVKEGNHRHIQRLSSTGI